MEEKLKNPKQNLSTFQHFFYDYGRYHNNNTNIIIHVICVPWIVVSLLRLTEYLSSEKLGLEFNIGYVLVAITSLLYLQVDFLVGTLTIFQNIFLNHYFSNNHVMGNNSSISETQFWLAVHIVCWILQFIGHGVFEKRKPALMDNIFLTLNAPIFVNLEVLYFLVGYRKEELLDTRKYIMYNIKQFKEGLIN